VDKFLNFIIKKEVIGTAITLLLMYLAFSLVKVISNKILNKSKSEFEKKRRKTVIELAKTIAKVIICSIVIIVILDLFGVNVTSLVASLGVASAVGALALQDTLKDVIAGAAIIMDNYFVVGDCVRYNGFLGTVIELGLRSTKIESFDGEVLIIANRNISEVTNLSQKTASSLIIAPVAYEEKVEKVEKIINEIIEEVLTWDTVKKNTTYIGINALKDSCIEYGIRLYCSPGKVWEYKRNILRLIKIKFDKNKIKIPYNQIEVHNNEN